MLISSAVAIFFSCSGATRFSEIEFDSESSVCFPRLLFETTLPNQRFQSLASRWTDEAAEG
jgi:hypothetical protein